MATFLFDQVIFGPVKSRRLGVSLGINLLPDGTKYCNFNCIYCECGWTAAYQGKEMDFPSLDLVVSLLDSRLEEMALNNTALDVITFAGNGEPTMHPKFSDILDQTILLRNKWYPKVKIAVLSNATGILKESVFNALKKADRNILKLDAGSEKLCRLINKPSDAYHLNQIVDRLRQFNGNVIIQSMFLRGTFDGISVDNTTDEAIMLWLQQIIKIQPQSVMIYSLDRDTPAHDLEKVSSADLLLIAERVKALGIEVVST